MAVKLPGSVTALFQSLRYSSNAKHHQQLQPGSTFSSHGAWTRLKRTGGLCFPGNIAKDRQDFFGRIVGLAAPFTVPRSIALDQKSLQVSCALSSFELDDVDLRRETGDGWSSSSTKQLPKSVHYRTTCNFQKSNGTSLRVPTPSQTFASARPRKPGEQDESISRQTQLRCMPQPRDTPPKRDTGIASEKEWGINLNKEVKSESGVNEDGSSWYSESGVDLGENGYRCRWTVMGGRSADGSSEWKEAWWEKSDWTGYKELGAEKSGKNAQGDTWWETWQEVLRVDELSNLARIEKSAQKQAKSGTGSAGWFEKWWEKYNAKGWSEKGAHKYGRLNDQGWWEKWEEQYDGRGAVLKWTDKWAESDTGTKWGDKWEEKFDHGVGTRQGETWHNDEKGWSRTWGEEHFGNGKVHKYGRSTSGENWDNVVEEGTYYQAEPHYGWADAIGNSVQLLSIQPLERPPGTFPNVEPALRDQQQKALKEESGSNIQDQQSNSPKLRTDKDQPNQE
ncbi:protein EARLY STARVATION 1, chloroplastic isoform X1 [Physcomitrium patens]|uniref:Inactive purple acid phosphatase-like protein n=2 Tax=Physcomitrium patens TaxID=3218 RepID=A0A2K1K9R5_PHYPA|nr:uncharacterized protein LOC112284861 isoform X1 [Physcomitrium patens]PNR50516.1 hypothetical protein PHYPA_009702 [Physcomitrium patens]|eukprot:XP_024380955.1 uncharacterized protein LOC112284861 isoform X1 [Physcomitrella patens]